MIVNETKTETIASTAMNLIIEKFSQKFFDYFGDEDWRSTSHWIRNPFECLLTELIGREQEELPDVVWSGCALSLHCTSTVCYCRRPSWLYVPRSVHYSPAKLSMSATICIFCSSCSYLDKIRIKSKSEYWRWHNAARMFVAHITGHSSRLVNETRT